MTRGSRTGYHLATRPGENFRLVPIKNLDIPPDHPRYAYDLTPDIAGALLDVDRASIYRFTRHGRNGRDGTRTLLPCWYPYGHPRGGAYYSLADLEDFARAAWKQPRPITYEYIPHWYIERHHRHDLEGVVKRPPVPIPPSMAGLAADERAAMELGYPRGAYLDGDSVYSPGGVLLNPGPDESAELRALAARELEAMKTGT